MWSSSADAIKPRWLGARALVSSSPSIGVVDLKAFNILSKCPLKPNHLTIKRKQNKKNNDAKELTYVS